MEFYPAGENQLLNDVEWEWLCEFYETHFDEIVELLRMRSPRLMLEDFYSLEPSLKSRLSENHLYVYQVNLAIQDGLLSQDMF